MEKMIASKTCAWCALGIAVGIMVLLMAGGVNAAVNEKGTDEGGGGGGSGGVSGSAPKLTLNITATPARITAGSTTLLTFIVTAAGNPVSGATVKLSGQATGSGTTESDGKVIISVNAANSGNIIAWAVLSGFYSGNTYIDVQPADLWISIDKYTVTAGTPTSVTFTTTTGYGGTGAPVSGASIILTGKAIGSGTTDANGKAIISVNATSVGDIRVEATKIRYIPISTTIKAVAPTNTPAQTATTTPAQTATTTPALSITATPETVYFGSSVTFTVTSAGLPVSGAELRLSGIVPGTFFGTTDNAGKSTFFIQRPTGKFISEKSVYQETAAASKRGFTSVSTTLNLTFPTPALNITATADTITAGTPIWVTFTVTNRFDMIPVSGAVVSLSGAASGRGTTDRNGEVTIIVNAASAGIITVTANKTGIPDGSTTITVTSATVPAVQALSIPTAASPTIITLQGKLTDSSGTPVQTGSMKVTISDSSGAQVWQETFEDIIDNGVFNIPLGAIQELRLVPGSIYSMEVAIDADSRKLSTIDVTFGDNSPAGDVIKFKA